ncbi:DUF3880 domain-containing protein [Arcobacter roscoffensis]|uniref:DUF3880 domain-containing protein n=1 Tax=Arcobacter roscoffensis TaxID=2961520 RepID=A0ABY5E2G9_9BACT|nr:DUF3880 domain-containing protein [Arcobacter roscoffensis]UTJ06376.1 DUF3880 domain-containing protein [Arcobacter roscoffensis]
MTKENKPLDTYFFSAEKALEIAKKQNRVETSVKMIDALQICYYASEKAIEDAPFNCIHVPLESVFDYFSSTTNRFPQAISFEDTEFSMVEQAELNAAFGEILGAAQEERRKLSQVYVKEIKEKHLDFKDEKLRVFIPACRETTVMQYVSKNIAEAFEKLGYKVYYHIQNELEDCNILSLFHNIWKFNPHIVVNINHLDNEHLNENTFNFSWFQDPMPIMYDKKKEITMRPRDYFFTLFEEYKDLLIKKGIDANRIKHQPFATNPKIFFKNNSIKKENKIVFLGSDYNFEEGIDFDDSCINDINNHIENNTLSEELITKYAREYGFEQSYFKTFLISSFVRRKVILWLCSLKDINIEVYGTDKWLNTPEVAPFYKGLLPYGPKMAEVYNSAKYSIAAHPLYRYQQRVIEMSACDCIPVIYNCPLVSDIFSHEENILSFSTFDELKECIGKEPQKNCTQIAEDISYEKMALSIIDTVEQQIKG